LIPTGPRTDHRDRPDAAAAPVESRSDTPPIAGPGTADWIGVPLPGDANQSPPDEASLTLRSTADAFVDGPSAAEVDERPDERSGEWVGQREEQRDGHPDGQRDGPAEVPRDEQLEHPDGQRDGPAEGDRDGHPGAQPEGPAPHAVTSAWYAELPVEDIRPNPRQPREVFDEEAMTELVNSIGQVGLLQPIVVRPLDEGLYELVMGERRWRAARQAGLGLVPAIVRETADEELLRDALLENLHRAELNALEEAAAYQQLLEDFGCTHDELASRIGRSRPQISNTIRLLKLSPPVQRRVAAGVLSAGHARALLSVDDPLVQDRLAGRVVAEGISVRGLEEIVTVGELGPASTAHARRSRPTAPGVDDLAARLSDRLETRVRVELGKRKGRITVEFASLPDLERIVAVIDPGHPTRTRQDTVDL
jgi:ParB family chromosome partitioning protein